MPGSTSVPDAFFLAEFGDGQLSSRLWRGGLRANPNGYTCISGTRSLSNSLKDGLDIHISDGTIESLINELEICWNDAARMRRACAMMCGHGRQTVLSVSLAKLVLSIDMFQPPMVTCVVNKISEYGEDSNGNADVARLLLNQLRWLDFIVDGPALCESLLAIVPVVSPSLQRAIVEALPEILDDASREVAVTELVKILNESPSMMGSVVDALGALGVDDERLPDVNSSILSTLNAANGDMLPVSLKYLLRTCTPPLMMRTVNALRHTLGQPGLGAASGRLCLDAVRAGLRMSKPVADHVIKVLKDVSKPSDHKVADLWILVALLDSPLHRKAAEVLFRKKADKRMFSRALLDAALAPFAVSFHGLTGKLLEMGSIAIRGSELGARQTGVLLYALIFRLFPSGSIRRNVVTALLDHIGTRKAQEMNAALEALALIALEGEGDRSLLPYSASIEGLLDFLEFFSDSQLRQIWTILGYLCRASSSKREKIEDKVIGVENKRGSRTVPRNESVDEVDDGGESELAMLEILLRKELTHADVYYRRIGVLGACTMIKVLGNSVRHNILQMLLEVGRSHSLSQALAFDELAQVFGGDDLSSKDTVESIRRTISSLFERRYVTDRSELGTLTKVEVLRPAELFGNLEGEDVEFCFSISKLIRDEKTLTESQDAVRAMVPSLRLLCVMTANCFGGSLAEVDAIIGAPLHIPQLPHDQDMGSLTTCAKGDLLLNLFVAHGWIVELLNGFAMQESAEIKAKCVKRVDELLALSGQISSCISNTPLWREVLFDAYNGSRANHHAQLHRGPDTKSGRGSRGNRISRDGKERQSTGSLRGHEWQSLARQLNPSALSLIRIIAPITWRFTETETEFARESDPLTESVSLSGKGLVFLLSELAQHIDNLVNGELRDSSSLGITLFRSSGAGASKSEKVTSISESGTDGRLKKFRALRTSLVALGPQLSRCMKKCIPSTEDEPVGDDETLEVHRDCIELCLRSLTISLSSKTLADAAAEDLLFTILASVRLDGSAPVEASDPFTSADIHIAAKHAFKQLRQTLVEVLSLDSSEVASGGSTGTASDVGLYGCCAFLAAMDAVLYFCSEKDNKLLGQQLSQIAYSLLKYSWNVSTLRSRKTQKLIPEIVKLCIQNAIKPFREVEALRGRVVRFTERQAELSNKPITTQEVNVTSSQDAGKLGSLTEQTCNAYTVALLEQYLWLFKKFQPQSFKEPEEAMERMQAFITAELPLYTLARQNQRLLGPVMRAGRALVDIFLKSCLPFLKERYREHRGSVIQICKMHQKPTRILQTFCAHSKFTRDTSLTGLVPPLRKSLELLLYRVKDLLQAHNASDAFQLGNLKHRDINGEVLGSQHLQYKSESENGSEYDSDDASDGAGEGRSDQRDAQSKSRKKSGVTSNSKRVVSRGRRLKKYEGGGRRSQAKRPKTKSQPKDVENAKNRTNAEDDDVGEGGDSAQEVLRRDEDSGCEEDDHISTAQIGRVPRRRADSARRKRRNALIDDEAEASDGEDDDDDDDDIGNLSQFLELDEEEEEE